MINTNELRDYFNLSAEVAESKIARCIWEAENIDLPNRIGIDVAEELVTNTELRDKYLYAEAGRHGGIANALFYLAYARYLANYGVTSTAAGDKVQSWLNTSQEVDYKTRESLISDNQNKGAAILNQVVTCMISDGVTSTSDGRPTTYKPFKRFTK